MRSQRQTGDFKLAAARSILLAALAWVAATSTAEENAALPAPTTVRREPAAVALTVDERKWIRAHPVVRLGIDQSWEPFVYVEDGKAVRGFDVEFLEAVSGSIGTRIELVPGRWADLVEQAKRRELDGLAQSAASEERAEWFRFSDRYMSHYYVLATTLDNAASIRRPGDLAGKRVAVQSGNAWLEKLVESMGDIQLVGATSQEDAFGQVVAGKADAACVGAEVARRMAMHHHYGTKIIHVFHDNRLDVVYSIRKDWPELVPILNKALRAIPEQEKDRLLKKYMLEVPTMAGPALNLMPEEQEWLAQDHIVRVRVIDFPPFMVVGAGEPAGISIDYLRFIAERTGIRFAFEEETRPFFESFEGLKNLEGPDLIGNLEPTPEREEKVYFSRSYFSSPRVIYVRNDDDSVLRMEDLLGKTVAIPRGIIIHTLLSERHPEIKIKFCDTDLQALEAVAKGEADAFIGILTMAASHIRKHGLTNLKVAGPSSFDEHVFCFGSRKDWPELSSIINRVLDTMGPKEEAAIRNKYMAVRYEHGIRPIDVWKWVLGIGAAAACLVFLLGFWNRSLKRQVQEHTADLQYHATLFSSVFYAQNIPMAILNTQSGERVDFNDSYVELTGYSREELRADTLFSLVIWDDPDEQKRALTKLVKDRCVRDYPARITTKSGEVRELIGNAVMLEVGERNLGITAWIDVTAEKHARRTVEESESRFRATFEQAAVGIAHVSTDGFFLRVNQKLCAITGYARAEMLALTFRDITHPDDFEADVEQAARLLRGDINTYTTEKRYIRASGNLVWVGLTVSVVRDEAGEPRWFVFVAQDITERRQAQDELKESEEKFRNLVHQSPVSIQIHDLEGRLALSNAAYSRLYALNEETLTELYEKYNVREDEQARQLGILPFIERVYSGEDVEFPTYEYDGVDTLKTLDCSRPLSRRCFVKTWGFPLRDEQGKVSAAVLLSEDITERKKTEAEVQAHQQRLRALASELVFVEERERKRIATDLHDGAAQSLTLARMQLADASEAIAGTASAAELDEASRTVRESLQQIRTVLLDLSSPSLAQMGLPEALSEWLTERVGKGHNLRTAFANECGDVPLADDARVILFRNVRELLANVVRHSEATRVSVSIACEQQMLRLTVEDDGVGFDPGSGEMKQNGRGGFGLFSIRERMADLGGSLRIDSAPGKGCRAILTMPLAGGAEGAQNEGNDSTCG